jgi:TGF-beta receptor type-1
MTKRKRGGTHHHLRHGEDSIEAPDHPILKGVSLQHMLEMTTSGSGSGEEILNCTRKERWQRQIKS